MTEPFSIISRWLNLNRKQSVLLRRLSSTHYPARHWNQCEESTVSTQLKITIIYFCWEFYKINSLQKKYNLIFHLMSRQAILLRRCWNKKRKTIRNRKRQLTLQQNLKNQQTRPDWESAWECDSREILRLWKTRSERSSALNFLCLLSVFFF